MKTLISFVCFALVLTGSLYAQETPAATADTTKDLKVVIKQDGKQYIGEIISDDGREIYMITKTIGKLYIRKDEIAEIKDYESDREIVDGVYKRDNIFSTRYFFSTNGFPVEKKDAYVMLNVWGPEFQVAVRKNTSIGLMTTWAGGPLAVTGKASWDINEKLHLGAGGILGSSTWIERFRYAGGLAFGSLTYGSRESNVSVATGILYMADLNPSTYKELYPDENGDVVTRVVTQDRSTVANLTSLSLITRIGKSTSFMMENFYFHDLESARNVFVMIPGLRFSKKRNQIFQIGLAGVFTKDVGFPLPLFGWMIKLN